MTSKEQTELRHKQINSLKWAIDELEKEKIAITSRWQKSNEAKDLKASLGDALSEKQALDGHIESLEDNLLELEDGEESPAIEDLESQKSSLEERIVIASERDAAFEQDRELERIAVRFRGDQFTGENEVHLTSTIPLFKDTENTEHSMEESTTDNRLQNIGPLKEPETESATRPHAVEAKQLVSMGSGSIVCSEATSDSLREAAATLDLEPEYLLDKSVQAVLRMIERNKNRVTFPLEVKQVDSID